MRDDLYDRMGLVVRRLISIRCELGEAALDRSLRDVLQALGASAMREAESSARILAGRRSAGARLRDIGSTGRGRIDDGIYEEFDG